MSLDRSLRKLRQARSLLEQLENANSGEHFAQVFSSLLAALKSTFEVLWKDLRGRSNYRGWYKTKEQEIRDDPLMSFLFDLRSKDLHEGEHKLLFSTHVDSMSINTPPGASFVLNPDGAYFIYNKGEPTERREPVRSGAYKTVVAMANPPVSHLRRQIEDTSPVALSKLGITYLENLLREASNRFG